MKFQDKYEHNVLQKYDQIFALTENCKRSLVSDYGIAIEKITTVRTGLGNVELKANRATHKKFTGPTVKLLTIAKSRQFDKGIDLLIESVKKLNENYEIKLTIVGKCNFSPLPDWVINRVDLTVEELNLIYEESDIFSLPARFEPYGLVYLEAATKGLPILATVNSGIAPEIIPPLYGRIVEADIDSITEGLGSIIEELPGLNHENDVSIANQIGLSFNWATLADLLVLQAT